MEAKLNVEEIDLTMLEELLEGYEVGDESLLIPLLQAAQGAYSYLPMPVLERIADHLKMPISRVYGVVTFYAQFYLTPRGRNTIRVCRGTACHVRGGPRILEELEKQLGIKEGGTTPDREFFLETVACIGACGLAPTMMINKNTYGHLTTTRIAEILDSIRPEEEGDQDEKQ